MSAAELKAKALIEEADKKMKPSFFSFLSNKSEEAAELYEKAAGQYKICKNWSEAAKTYVLAAETQKKAGSPDTANYVEAAKCYKKCSPADAIQMYQIACEMYMDSNRFSAAAKLFTTIGELCEADHDLTAAIEAYSQSADCYSSSDSTTSRNQQLLQVANLSAQMQDYTQSIEIYERVANESVDNKLLSWGAKDHFFRAALCHLALASKSIDFGNSERALERYQDIYPSFSSSREYKFLVAVLDAFKDGDVEKFTDVVYEFDNISKLDNWKTAILLTIKKSISGGSGDSVLDPVNLQ